VPLEIALVETPVARPPVGNPNADKPHASSAPAEFTVESTPTTRSPAASPNAGNGDKPSSSTLQTFGGPTGGTASVPTTGGNGQGGAYQQTDKCLQAVFDSICICEKAGECARRLKESSTCKLEFAERNIFTPSAWTAYVNSFLQDECPNYGSKNGAWSAMSLFSSQQNGIDQRTENCIDTFFDANCDCSKVKECAGKIDRLSDCEAIYENSGYYSEKAWREFVNGFLKQECPSASKVGGFTAPVIGNIGNGNGQPSSSGFVQTAPAPAGKISTVVSTPVASPTQGNGGKPVVQPTSAPNGKISTLSTPVASPTGGNGNVGNGGKPVVQPTSTPVKVDAKKQPQPSAAPVKSNWVASTPVASPTGGNGGKPVVQPTSAPVVVKISANKQPQPSAAPVRVNGNGNKPV
jgi:hypothetical protein